MRKKDSKKVKTYLSGISKVVLKLRVLSGDIYIHGAGVIPSADFPIARSSIVFRSAFNIIPASGSTGLQRY